MASVRKRNDKWQAQVRRTGHTPRSKTFLNRADALRWVRQTELELDRAALTDLRFHDLRHEAVSRFFELGLSVPEVATISGHKAPRMLFRYTRLKPQDIVAKLRKTATELAAWIPEHLQCLST